MPFGDGFEIKPGQTNQGGQGLPSFTEVPTTPEPPVVEQELPEDQTGIPPAEGKQENTGIIGQIGSWLQGAREKVKEQVDYKKKMIENTWNVIKNTLHGNRRFLS